MPEAQPHQEDPSAWSSGEVLRLLLAPTIATLLFAGGVYWVRLQWPASAAGQDQASIVQVHLVPRPDPAPVPVATTAQTLEASVASHAAAPVDESDPMALADKTVVPVPAPTPAEDPAPSISPTASPMDAPPSRTAVKFQQALTRHVARYQRYPKAARRGQLHGAVETLFSMRRDGTLLGVWVKTSSGQPVLDKEAVDTIRRAQPLPPIPSELPDRLNIQMSLLFDPS
jgi:protein TonB